ncbi:hypothetical protein KKH18_06490 [bacterium]|nr:hypothetical protein [bacterium]
MADLLVIVPDLPIKDTIEAIHISHAMLGIGQFVYNVYRDPGHDSAVYSHAHELARAERSGETYALAIMDYHGTNCKLSIIDCQKKVSQNLARVSFGDGNTACIAIDPEFERWALFDRDELARVLNVSLIELNMYIDEARAKHPHDLEKQVKLILYQRNRAKSSKLEARDIPRLVDLRKWLPDPQFAELVNTLQNWFPLRLK